MATRYNTKAEAIAAKARLYPNYGSVGAIWVPEIYEKAKGLKMGWYLWTDIGRKHL
jgi:hypothetical protein